MRRLYIAVAIVVLAIVALPLLLARHNRSEEVEPEPAFSAPTPVTSPAQTEQALPASPGLERWLNHEKLTMTGMRQPEDIGKLLTIFKRMHPDVGLRFEFEPGVNGKAIGSWRNTPFREVLDDICRQNNLKWEVVGPSTIRIRPKE